MIQKLKYNTPIYGDDNPTISQWYRDVPADFTFSRLTYKSDCPLSIALKDKLSEYADRYYRNFEIVGMTYVDFFENLQLSLDENIDNFEKFLKVYYDDIANPTQSRTIKRTYDITDASSGTATSKVTASQVNKGFELPIDNSGAHELDRDTADSSSSSDSGSTGTVKKTGSETEDWSDVGVAPNYELLNGFLDNNRTFYQVFVSYFRNCFTLMEDYHVRY